MPSKFFPFALAVLFIIKWISLSENPITNYNVVKKIYGALEGKLPQGFSSA